jgi:hypothetical protein
MGIQLGISCVDSLVLPVDIPIYQAFWGFEPVCKKYLQTILVSLQNQFLVEQFLLSNQQAFEQSV